ncbi:MAG: hypothetical protein AAF264_11450 [Pseudomonadota bacterium]
MREALRIGADAARDWYIDELETAVDAVYATMAEVGVTVVEALPEMRQAWADGMGNAAATWAADLDARGAPGSEMLRPYMDALRAARATPLRDWDAE